MYCYIKYKNILNLQLFLIILTDEWLSVRIGLVCRSNKCYLWSLYHIMKTYNNIICQFTAESTTR